ncbi:MAG: hypothetical protein ABIA63_01555 [bacterium]
MEKYIKTKHDKLCIGGGIGFSVTDYRRYNLEFGEYSPWPNLSLDAGIGDFPVTYALKYFISWDRGFRASYVGALTQDLAKWRSREVQTGMKYFDSYKRKFRHYWCLGGLGRYEELIHGASTGLGDNIYRPQYFGLGLYLGSGIEWAFIEHMVAEISFKFSRTRTYIHAGGLKNYYTLDFIIFFGD